MDELTRMLDLPAAARLSIAGDEIALLTLRHEHADKIIIERRRLGTSIDLGELLQLIGGHGLADVSPIQIHEVVAPQLPAPAEVAAAPLPTARRTTKHQQAPAPTPEAQPERVPCPVCERTFDPRGLGPHMAKAHKPEPTPVLVAQNTATSNIPVPVKPATDGICGVCNTSVKLHERCSDCTALLGPEHEAGPVVATTFDHQPLCATCLSFRDVAREIGVAA